MKKLVFEPTRIDELPWEMESRKVFQKGMFGDFSCPGLHGPLGRSTHRGTKSYQEGTHACMCGTPAHLYTTPDLQHPFAHIALVVH